MRVAWKALGLWLLAALPAWSQPFEISWWTVDAGGATGAAGGTFGLDATAGQHDAGGPFSGGPYLLHSGFWSIAGTGVGTQADLSITKSDGQPTAIPGLSVTYTITASNLGPNPVTGATVSDPLPTALTSAGWTCVATPGSSCPPTGAGSIAVAVNLQVGGTATFTLMASVDPAAAGTLVNTASIAVPPGVVDPVGANNAAVDTDTLTPVADLGVVVNDTPDPVAAGGSITYSILVSTLGPSDSPGATLVNTLPAAVSFVSVSPGSPTCTHASGVVTCTLGVLAPSATLTVTVQGTVSPSATGPLTDQATIDGIATDPVAANDSDTETTQILATPAEAEMVHGLRLVRSLAAAGGAPGQALCRIRQQPYSSYEVVVDAASGDLGTGQGPLLERIAADGSTVLAAAQAVGNGPARSLRIVNATSSAVDDNLVRVRSASCGSDCGADDVFRLRAFETTAAIPRFNNSATQITVLVLQNRLDVPVAGHAYFWGPTGVLLHDEPVALDPHAVRVVSTATVPALTGQSGSVTLAHDGPFGAIAGKAVALEPATGFSFDSSLETRR